MFFGSCGIIGSAEPRTVLGNWLPRSGKPTVSFNGKSTLDWERYPHSAALHVVERIWRVDYAAFRINPMIAEPRAYPRPWGAKLDFQLRTDWRIMEPVFEDNASFLGLIDTATEKPSK